MALGKDALHLEQRIPCPLWRAGGRVVKRQSGRAGQSNAVSAAGFPVGRGRGSCQIFQNKEAQNRGLLFLFLLGLWEEPASLAALHQHGGVMAEDNGEVT